MARIVRNGMLLTLRLYNSSGSFKRLEDAELLPWKEAEEKIRIEYPNITIQVLPENSMVTMDYREDRVRIFTDGEGKVATKPIIG